MGCHDILHREGTFVFHNIINTIHGNIEMKGITHMDGWMDRWEVLAVSRH